MTGACWLLTSLIGYGAIALVYVLGVLIAGTILDIGPVLLVAALSGLCWNFLFIPPLFTFHIAKLEDALTFATYFIVALTVGGLTARLRAREHIAAQVQVAQESERLRKTLLDCVSHELKTPLAAIAGASQELSRLIHNSDAAIVEQLAQEIRAGSVRLNRVIDNLLDMNRLESGVVRPRLEWCDVHELVQSAISSESEAINGREVTLDVPETLPLALLDHMLIEQAVAKLLANAATYTTSPVEVAANCANGTLHISVSDRGPGFSSGSAQQLFDKFYRGERRKTGGLGLGLSIARGFAEAHGGTVTATNRDGGGAQFTISLPVKLADAKAVDVDV
jgi:two-component system sensor histidine kinase KdpD